MLWRWESELGRFFVASRRKNKKCCLVGFWRRKKNKKQKSCLVGFWRRKKNNNKSKKCGLVVGFYVMASFGGGVAAIVGGGRASSTVHNVFTKTCCLQQSEARRVGGVKGGGYESNEGSFSSSASLFCRQRFGGWVVPSSSSSSSSCCQERQLPLRRGAVAQPRAFSGGATTVRTSSSASTLYDVLGVSKSSSAKEIKTAYRQAARKLHPDVVPAEHRQDSTKDFLVIQNAYHVLSDDQSRAAYDLQLSVLQQQHHRIPTISMESNWGFTASPPNPYTSADFCSPFKGRSWETDQCW